MSNPIQVRKCETLTEFSECVELQRAIWGEDDLEVEPATMFVVASHTGGQVLGAFDGQRLIGYTLAVVGLDGGEIFLHSHMTGVHEAYRDRGVGRLLKLHQREEALQRGIRLIRWTFDPLEIRNAHFNLNRLGAICRTYLPNLYGITTSPLHRGLATDRLLAEWRLDSPRILSALKDSPIEPVGSSPGISLPAELDHWKKNEPQRLSTVQERLREEFLGWFAKGYAAVALKPFAQGSTYVLRPIAEIELRTGEATG